MLDILVFAPHPDDAELGAGGILARHAALGRAVGVVDLTRGEMGDNGTAEERAAEAAEAARILGLAVRENLALPDAGLAVNETTVARLVEAIRRHRPRLLLAPYWDDPHPDHRATAHAVVDAMFKAGLRKFLPGMPPYRPARLAYYFINTEVEPHLIVDVTAYYNTKETALTAHRSQFQCDAGRIPSPLNDNVFLRRIQARDARWGALIGARYGEGLLLDGPLSAGDLLQIL